MNSLEDNISKVGILTERVELAAADIAPTYYDYMRLAFALATDLGESGRSYFHRLCAPSPKYRRADAEKLYDQCLRKGGRAASPCTLGTVFHLLSTAGLDTDGIQEEIQRDWTRRHARPRTQGAGKERGNAPFPQSYCNNNNNSGEGKEEGPTATRTGDPPAEEPDEDWGTVMGADTPVPLPTFPAYDWPWPIGEALGYAATDAERDVMLLSVVAALGSTLNWTARTLYGGLYRYPQLYVFVLANAASGKSIIDYSKLFCQPLHRERREETRVEMEKYRKAMRKFRMAVRKGEAIIPDEPRMPRNRLFIIPANNSATGMLQCLIDSGGNGHIQESEADTLSLILKSDFGNWSDVMRKAYDHTGVSFNRRTDREYAEISHTRLGMVIAGTPAQLCPLIPSAENGLFSRQLFYFMPGVTRWADQIRQRRGGGAIDVAFQRLADRWERVRREIEQAGCHTLVLTDGQAESFNSLMDSLFTEQQLIGGEEIRATVVRLGVAAVRIGTTVAMARIYGDDRREGLGEPTLGTHPLHDGPCQHREVSITDDDWAAVTSLIPILLRHANHVLSFLPSSQVKRSRRFERDELLRRLPDVFSMPDAVAVGTKLGVKPATTRTWIKRLTAAGLLEQEDRYGGMYKKKSTLEPLNH